MIAFQSHYYLTIVWISSGFDVKCFLRILSQLIRGVSTDLYAPIFSYYDVLVFLTLYNFVVLAYVLSLNYL